MMQRQKAKRKKNWCALDDLRSGATSVAAKECLRVIYRAPLENTSKVAFHSRENSDSRIRGDRFKQVYPQSG
jgi:hypothetical protein